jgi:hypothetical protein
MQRRTPSSRPLKTLSRQTRRLWSRRSWTASSEWKQSCTETCRKRSLCFDFHPLYREFLITDISASLICLIIVYDPLLRIMDNRERNLARRRQLIVFDHVDVLIRNFEEYRNFKLHNSEEMDNPRIASGALTGLGFHGKCKKPGCNAAVQTHLGPNNTTRVYQTKSPSEFYHTCNFIVPFRIRAIRPESALYPPR